MPALDQEMVFPWASVMVIMVLLKLAFTCATPEVMFLRSRRLTRPPPGLPSAAAGLAMSSVRSLCARPSWIRREPGEFLDYFVTCFLPAIATALPLRVRALVCV